MGDMSLKNLLQKHLESIAVRYIKKHKPKLVVVVGSVGKTSTKLAIATVLGEKYRVRAQEGNHNTPLAVPLSILGVKYPENVHSIFGWVKTIFSCYKMLRIKPDIDVIVQELGVDHVGDMKEFTRYLHPDIAVVTAVSDEHMEYFENIDNVAREELSISEVSSVTVVNVDDISADFSKYVVNNTTLVSYGLNDGAEYKMVFDGNVTSEGRSSRLISKAWGELPVNIQLIGDHSAKALIAASCVGDKLGFSSSEIAIGVSKVTSVSGRMNVLRGLEESVLIDDTYNSSPLAAKAALTTLYEIDAPQRIVILGSMNELGNISSQAHKEIGELCDPVKLDWVVTIGDEAAKYLAPAAEGRGCQARSFKSPYDAGSFVHGVMKPRAVILAKGSQNGVFAEEALKILLHEPDEQEKLVRQSPAWLKIKREQFEVPVARE
jgi:UDP-N-acetylmuramoyl-tripeptide--D-alanyl-D-alanine ligase